MIDTNYFTENSDLSENYLISSLRSNFMLREFHSDKILIVNLLQISSCSIGFLMIDSTI